jgi:cytochrome P450
MSDSKPTCPVNHASLPGDGTPMKPSPSFAKWRAEAPATPLKYQDGHDGLIATGYDLARSVLSDPRFSMRPERLPMGPVGDLASDKDVPNAALPAELPGPLDEDAQISEQSNLLIMDGDEHSKLRRLVTPRFSLKQARSRREWISKMVSEQLASFKAKEQPADIWRHYGLPIAARTHCHVLGVPDSHLQTFISLFEGSSTAQQKYDFIREVLELRKGDPGEDVISDLLASEEITRHETEGVLRLLMGAGRDSVAYLIATTSVALLTNPDQLEILLADPEKIDSAVEEFMRYGAMFITLFPRTALEDVELEGVLVKAGQSVSVSSVAANRDPARWENPDVFDVTRDGFGHLGFSYGIHGCIGQQVARIEISEGIRQLILGCKGLKLVHAEQLTPMPFAHPVAVYEAGAVMVEWNS